MDLSLVPYRKTMTTTPTQTPTPTHHDNQRPVMSYPTTDPKPASTALAAVRYRECLRNHAASIGGHANDGCGEFMPSNASANANANANTDLLKCAACGCHRNFHRKEISGSTVEQEQEQEKEQQLHYNYNYNYNHDHHHYYYQHNNRFMYQNQNQYPYNNNNISTSSNQYQCQYYQPMVVFRPSVRAVMDVVEEEEEEIVGGEEEEEEEQFRRVMERRRRGGGREIVLRKRYRTKFSAEQKEKMVAFAEKMGWRIQKHQERILDDFCSEVGVDRRVLKVWMHNNKNNTLAKKHHSNSISAS